MTSKKVARVIMRLTRAPMTRDEYDVVCYLLPGKHAKWITASERRLMRSLHERIIGAEGLLELSYAQRRWLWRIALRYRHRLTRSLRDRAWEKATEYRAVAKVSDD